MHLMRASTECAVSNLVRAWGVSPQTKEVKNPAPYGPGPDRATDSEKSAVRR